MSKSQQRAALLSQASPYRERNEESKRRKERERGRPPRDLMRWFLEGLRDELPERLHSRGVWHDEPHHDPDGYQAVGGSLIGSPRPAEGFRQFIEDGAFVTELSEYEGHKDARPSYRYPMRAALARLAGRGGDNEQYPFMARMLYRTFLREGDWSGACASLGIIEPVRRPYVEAALYRLWNRYAEEPPTRLYEPSTEEAA